MSVRPRETLAAALFVGAALLSCKAKSKLSGSVSVNGATIDVKDCSVGHATASFGGTSTSSSFVSLIDASENRIQISESDHSVRVSYLPKGGSFVEVGSGCGTLTFTTPPTKSPSEAVGHLAIDCNGSGYHVVARVGFAGCGTYGL